jgi:hypothetical protein
LSTIMILATLAFQPVLAPSPTAAVAVAKSCQMRVDGSLRTVATASALTEALGRTLSLYYAGINTVLPPKPAVSEPNILHTDYPAFCDWNGTRRDGPSHDQGSRSHHASSSQRTTTLTTLGSRRLADGTQTSRGRQ